MLMDIINIDIIIELFKEKLFHCSNICSNFTLLFQNQTLEEILRSGLKIDIRLFKIICDGEQIL